MSMITPLAPVAIKSGGVYTEDNIDGTEKQHSSRSLHILTLSALERSNYSAHSIGNVQVELLPPVNTNKTLQHSTKIELTQRLSDARQGKDIDNIEQVVSDAASLCRAQLFSGLTGSVRQSGNSYFDTTDSAKRDSGSTLPALSHAAIEGGTDITATTSGSSGYSNMMGSMGVMDAYSSMMRSLNQYEAQFNASAAKWSEVSMKSAKLAGDHIVKAAELRLAGSITSGVVSGSVQAISCYKTAKALTAENKSITKNLAKSQQIDKTIEQNKSILNGYRNEMQSEGNIITEETKTRLGEHLAEFKTESQSLYNRHQQVSNNAQKVRVQGDSVTQLNMLGQRALESGFEVASAEQRKSEEIIRANQTVSNGVDNIHQQSSKKANEGESALRQSLLAILNNNNDALSAVASRMA